LVVDSAGDVTVLRRRLGTSIEFYEQSNVQNNINVNLKCKSVKIYMHVEETVL